MSDINDINSENMEYEYVIKRDGGIEKVKLEKINARIEKLCDNLNINSTRVTRDICKEMYNGMKTSELDELGAKICANLCTEHPDYGVLASRIIISNLHKNTSPSFSETMHILYENVDIHENHSPLISKELYEIVDKHKSKLNDTIKYERDYYYDYFGYKTLERSYLMRIKKLDKTSKDTNDLKGVIIERPQHLIMRVALGIHGENIKEVIKTYDYMSNKYFIHATPTLFNAGTNRPQLSSCFLLSMKNDSIDGIYSTLKDCAMISKWAGGIGLHVNNIRAKNSIIRGTNGISNGLIPMLRVFNNTARYVDQGGGKRNGSIAIYLEPWHADILDFLLLKRNRGNEEERARDLFYALWVCDLFMERVKNEEDWSLFCPDECPGLSDCYGEKFNALYKLYEDGGRAKSTIPARKLWLAILESQIETGTPYILYKDHCNRKSNQQNLGTIKSSNLCCEIMEYSSPEEYAVCNLGSIGLSKFVNEDRTFDYEKLIEVSRILTRNLDKIIDVNFYPVPETKRSNSLHRPIGVGVQGLADVFAMMKIPFDSEEARYINKKIFETIYYGSLTESCLIAKEREEKILEFIEYNNNPDIYESMANNDEEFEEILKKMEKENNIIPEELNRNEYFGTYSSYIGSPLYNGKLQFDMWDEDPSYELNYDWESLRGEIKKYGVRNSLLVAPMPTASTSQILGNNECFEPFTSNIYLRRTLAGEFIIVNKYLIKDLIKIKRWNKDVKNQIIKDNGSIQNIEGIPNKLKQVYKTVWEISNKSLIDMSADRGRFICQSQSLNLFSSAPDYNKLSKMHFYSWSKGLKTGLYYLRTRPVAKAQQFTIEPENKNKENNDTSEATPEVSSQIIIDDNNQECEMCSG